MGGKIAACVMAVVGLAMMAVPVAAVLLVIAVLGGMVINRLVNSHYGV